jgi:hypothetical protein
VNPFVCKCRRLRAKTLAPMVKRRSPPSDRVSSRHETSGEQTHPEQALLRAVNGKRLPDREKPNIAALRGFVHELEDWYWLMCVCSPRRLRLDAPVLKRSECERLHLVGYEN